jgi:isopentenyl-diphosphate Delta-isomerase
MDREMFEIFNEQHQLIGCEERLVVHKTGLLHQAAHVVVFSSGGKVLLQKRAASKRIAPGLWDLSCAEHLQPGESFRQAAVRGMKEELGLEIIDSSLTLLRPMQLYRRTYDSGDYQDNEFCELFQFTIDDEESANVVIDPDEVAEIAWMGRGFVYGDLLARPDLYTPWLQSEREYLLHSD